MDGGGGVCGGLCGAAKCARDFPKRCLLLTYHTPHPPLPHLPYFALSPPTTPTTHPPTPSHHTILQWSKTMSSAAYTGLDTVGDVAIEHPDPANPRTERHPDPADSPELGHNKAKSTKHAWGSTKHAVRQSVRNIEQRDADHAPALRSKGRWSKRAKKRKRKKKRKEEGQS